MVEASLILTKLGKKKSSFHRLPDGSCVNRNRTRLGNAKGSLSKVGTCITS